MQNVAEHIIGKCGGAQAVALMLNLDVSSVHKWKYPVSKGGTGGVIPAHRQQDLLDAARARGIRLKPEDFFQAGARKASA